MYTCVCLCMCVYEYTYTNTHTYIHMQQTHAHRNEWLSWIHLNYMWLSVIEIMQLWATQTCHSPGEKQLPDSGLSGGQIHVSLQHELNISFGFMWCPLCMCICVYVWGHVHVCIWICIYIPTYTHIYAQTNTWHSSIHLYGMWLKALEIMQYWAWRSCH